VPRDWIVPDWPAPARVRAVCTTRGASVEEGASRGFYRFFNVGNHVGDDSAAVAANREQLARVLAARPVFMRQVHGHEVLRLSPDVPDEAVADGAVATERGLACTIMVADCLPILLADDQGCGVAAAHAGWRGLSGGVVEATLETLRVATQSVGSAGHHGHVMAWLGPCIGLEAFEVGEDVYAAFVHADSAGARFFAPQGHGKYLADLAGLARLRLNQAGVQRIYGNDGTRRWCTVSNPARLFSYRHAQKHDEHAGRMAACVWLA
jgi:YfiH family protein